MSQELLQYFLSAWNGAIEASYSVMNYFNEEIEVMHKSDESPVTKADLEANEIIFKHLSLTGIKIISEETVNASFNERKNESLLWVVDPIDGTKEFIKKSNHFTVNIALIQDGYPVLGIVIAPALSSGYAGIVGMGAVKVNHLEMINDVKDFFESGTSLPFADLKNIQVVGSYSGMNTLTSAYIERIGKHIENLSLVRVGSSLKFCLVSEGSAHFYPRLAGINEWDTAAGHAVLRASGGEVLTFDKQVLQYNKPDLFHQKFIALSAGMYQDMPSFLFE
jgi:3'(2'), 5'-bisphosphate nucleotidase